jgi:hypothetical protein
MGWWSTDRGTYWRGHHTGCTPVEDIPEEAEYNGPCRCGHGPNAHYRLVVHASGVPIRTETNPEGTRPLDYELETEIERLRSRVQELERRLEESTGRSRR